MGWANKLLGYTSNNGAEVNVDGSLQVTQISGSGPHYALSTKTGTIAAAAAAGATVFAMRLSPTAATKKAYIHRIRLRWTTIVAFTTPITQTRSLVVTRGSGAAASGGTAVSTTKKDSTYTASQFEVANGGSVQVSTTGALTVTGITFEVSNLAEYSLIQVGAAGAFYEVVEELQLTAHPIELSAGELLAIRVGPSAMDAAGTWSLNVQVDWRESTTEA
jgi:hypothetical protein